MSTLPPRALRRRLLGWPGAGADLVLLVALASVVTVVSRWLTGGGVQEMGSGTGAALTSLGRLAGLAASDLLLLQVVAMARIPWVERPVGQDRLARWHRIGGFSSFSLLLAHVLPGDTVATEWGPVQVELTVVDGRITDVVALQYPSGNPRDQQINAYALPVLHDEVVAAQSAHIDHVSGATVTSDGYLTSLQSALDKVNL